MRRVLPPLLIALLALVPVAVGAQDLGSAPITVDPVAAALAADAPESCDDIGRTILFSDLDNPDFPIERAIACNRELGATVMAACTLPLTDTAVLKDQLRLAADEAFVVCNVAVAAVGESQVFLLPEQFSLLTSADAKYLSLQGFLGTEVDGQPECNSPKAVISSGGGLCGGYLEGAQPVAEVNCHYAVYQPKQSGQPIPPECADYESGHYQPARAVSETNPGSNSSLDIRILQSDTVTPRRPGEGVEFATGSLVFKVQTPLPVPFLLVWEPSTDTSMVAVVNERFLDPADLP